MLVDILRVLDNTQLVSNFQPRASSSFTEENEHALIQKSNKKSCTLNAEIIIGQVPGYAVACYYPYHASTKSITSGLFLEKRKKGFVKRNGLSHVNSATYLTCQQPSICVKTD